MILFFDGGCTLTEEERALLERLEKRRGQEEVISVKICGDMDDVEWNDICRYLEDAEAIVLAADVRLNSVSSEALAFLEKVEGAVISGESIGGRFYAVLFTDLYEGMHTSIAMGVLKNFCMRANITWGRGLGIGGNGIRTDAQRYWKWKVLAKKKPDFRLGPIREQMLFIKEKLQGTDVYINPDLLSKGTYIRKLNREMKKSHRVKTQGTLEQTEI